MNSEPINDLASKEAFFERATALCGENRLDEAESLYRAILKVDPANIGSLHNLATLCIQQCRGQEAVELLREPLRQRSDLAVAHHTLGIALRHLGRVQEAEICCRETLRLERIC
jgi:Flp pilus assembly protein TadD